jgi:hypothetical protein
MGVMGQSEDEMLARQHWLSARRIPWWLVLLLGVSCVAVGMFLTVRPFRSLSVLAWLVAAALLLTGLSTLASAGAATRPWLSRLVGGGWIVAGLLSASY